MKKMKKLILKTILVLLTCTVYVSANAQQVTSTPAQPTVKTFIITAETAKDLPEGVAFINNKVTAKPGYKFEQLPNGGGVRLVETQNLRNVKDGYYVCNCNKVPGGAGSCTVSIFDNTLSCDGDDCCSLAVTVNIPPKKNVIKKGNTIKKSGTVETKQ
jgi:hypothetical protein